MQAIILAAGRGIRLGSLTENTPKPLLKIGEKPILQHVFESLPSEIDEVLVVVKYLGNKIKEYFGNNFSNFKIQYVEQGEMAGTAGALWSARPWLDSKPFLVINSDDWYALDDLQILIKHELAIGLYPAEAADGNLYGVRLDGQGNLCGFEKEAADKKLVAMGAYMLDQRIFNYEPVKIKNGEYGLPQTLLKLALDYPVSGVMMKNWFSGNTTEDLKKMEKFLKLNR